MGDEMIQEFSLGKAPAGDWDTESFAKEGESESRGEEVGEIESTWPTKHALH